jgi:hypothetical protein
MKKRVLSSDDIFYNATFLIPEMYQRGSNDSLNAVVEFWGPDLSGNTISIQLLYGFSRIGVD